jgi:formate dehydrogenase major subunit
MFGKILDRWPAYRQLRDGLPGTGREVMSRRTLSLRPKNDGADVARSVCPYCGVGCGQLVFHRDGRMINIEGDPQSPISEGHLCPKGAASYQLLHHPGRLTRVKYRPPRATEWTEIPLERAMDMIADRVWQTRERTFIEARDGHVLMQCTGIAHLGGATLDNEENYLFKKLWTAGLGITRVSNQARI